MTRIKEFPPAIFVTVGEDGDTDFLLASLTKRDALDGEERKKVAIYSLSQIQEVREGLPVSKTSRSRKSK